MRKKEETCEERRESRVRERERARKTKKKERQDHKCDAKRKKDSNAKCVFTNFIESPRLMGFDERIGDILCTEEEREAEGRAQVKGRHWTEKRRTHSESPPK